MLLRMEVDGFRSLSNFVLDLRPGLNVLIGPNGAGKTNVVKFLELLSDLATHNLSDAISRSGGAGLTFNRRDLEKKEGRIWARVSGFCSNSARWREKMEQAEYVQYEYEFIVELRENAVLFTHQHLKLAMTQKKPTEARRMRRSDLVIRWYAGTSDKTSNLNMKFSKKLEQIQDDIHTKRIDMIIGKLQESKDLTSGALFMLGFVFDLPIWGIARDVQSGRAYNINPSRVREPEDIAQRPGIDFEGKGLASTLYNLQHRDREEDDLLWMWGRSPVEFRHNAKHLVQEYAKIVNQDIVRIEAVSDPIQNKIFVFGVVNDETQTIKIPITLLSDGTVKWLSLIVALLSSRSTFLIEEPENFLHPKLQQEIVRIVRATCEADEKSEMIAIMTSHSETLLNALYPEEVIVTAMSKRQTVCRRPNNMDVLSDIINETGFGLGHLYVTDAIVMGED